MTPAAQKTESHTIIKRGSSLTTFWLVAKKRVQQVAIVGPRQWVGEVRSRTTQSCTV